MTSRPGGAVSTWRSFRDRLLSSRRFQRWAVRFPLTRPVARRHTRTLFDLCAGFVYSQILLACVRLEVFERLADGPRSLSTLAADLALPIDACQRLLDGAVALELIECRGTDLYGLGPLGAATLGNPGIRAMVDHHQLLYRDLTDPVALLRDRPQETELSRYWSYARQDCPGQLEPDVIDEYTSLMASSQAMIADEVLDAYPLDKHRALLDVGGGDGTFARAAAERAAHLNVTVFDLPAVAGRARDNFEQHGLAARATAIGGDFLVDELPKGADIITLVRIVHDHEDDSVKKLLAAARHALPDDGVLLLAEPMAGTKGATAAGDAYFGMYLFAMGQGRPRTSATLDRLLQTAGFGRVREIPTGTPLLTRLLKAQP